MNEKAVNKSLLKALRKIVKYRPEVLKGHELVPLHEVREIQNIAACALMEYDSARAREAMLKIRK